MISCDFPGEFAILIAVIESGEAMSYQADLSFLDRAEILEIIFPVVYSPFYLPDDARFSPAAVPASGMPFRPLFSWQRGNGSQP
ncbi:MAG: hypothetical protein HYY80_02405 [Chloroflexi bacterium]|nr:hypothetical protein [Chloroflexota bacterium]